MSEPCRCERADAIRSLVASANATAKALAERDEALAALARVEAVCVTGTRVATERMVSGSVVHVAAKDAIDTFAKAIRGALEETP
jgi:hypothetical protein